MTDIVERLKIMRTVGGKDWACMDDAQTEIKSLRQQIGGFPHLDDLRQAMIDTVNENDRLHQQLAEAHETLKDHGEIQAALCRQLSRCHARENAGLVAISFRDEKIAEGEAREKVLRDALQLYVDIESLRQQLAEFKAEMKMDAEGPDWIQRAMQAEAALQIRDEQLAEAYDNYEKLVTTCEENEEALKQQLAECQARNAEDGWRHKGQRTTQFCGQLEEAVKQAKRKTLLEALIKFQEGMAPGNSCYGEAVYDAKIDICDVLKNMAKELE